MLGGTLTANLSGGMPRAGATRLRLWEFLCVAVYLLILVGELIVPPFLGISNNADFAKALSPLSMGPEHPVDNPLQQDFKYFTSDYTTNAKWYRPSYPPSSEIPMVWLTRGIAREITRSDHFDIRYFAALIIALLAFSLYIAMIFLRTQPAAVRCLLPPLILFIFSDAVYGSYANSFYMDAASIVFCLCTTASMCMLTQSQAGVLWPLVFAASGVLLVTSKPNHAPLGFLLVTAALWFASREHRLARRLVLLGAAAAILAVTPMMLKIPAGYTASPLYNSIFLNLAAASPDPARSLEEVGLSADDTKWIGANAFDLPTPMTDPAFRRSFVADTSYGRVLTYYLRHPVRLIRRFHSDLKYNSNPVQPFYANYRKVDGFPPGAQARSFHLWSSIKNRLLRYAPYHVLVVYLGLLWGFWRTPLFPVVLFLVVAGGLEFVVASLGDGMDTNRHLILFHLITDVAFVFLAGGTLATAQRWVERRRGSALHVDLAG
jgi:hypothetical protein